MKFIKYPSIENAYRKQFIDYLILEKLTDGEFVVQEKAHGANFSFCYDGQTLTSAKRSGFIKDDFYEYKSVEEKYQDKIIQVYQLLKQKGHEFSDLIVYGELIGGTYPHKAVPKDNSATKIQKGIFYTPHNDFYAIDAVLDGQLLDIDSFNALMEEAGFFYAKTLFRGTFEACLTYPNIFSSQIPLWLGLPEIENNTCEGIVIKPVIPKYMSNNERVILKSKNEKWEEKIQKKAQNHHQEPELSQNAVELLDDLMSFVTENRLNNVLSKTGPIEKTEFGKLLCAYSADVLEDFYKEYAPLFNSLDKKEQKYLTRKLNEKSAALIRLNFLNIVDKSVVCQETVS
ncbi:MAG: hypothetical protein HQK77_15790 [Desulfobacterales bacterium]|nr:hypothetical protein [Desulfobacterales bacterium]